MLLEHPGGGEYLVEGVTDVGGLLATAAAVEAERGDGSTWVDAWLHGSRSWSDVDPNVIVVPPGPDPDPIRDPGSPDVADLSEVPS
ncbi:hypothetical protein HUN59_14880 [Curtobacterium sp. Csp2]|nr:hypothetical protein HUN59_14880 [Curtobacterium sp. Csp2]